MNSNERDSYLTVFREYRAPELKISGSRFIPIIIPVATKQEAESALKRIRKEFYDATHHCYAYRLGINGEYSRAADDGEPAGTAGRPILTILQGAELTNVLCVATRYFGGTKLGTGGLARAYSETARLAVEGAGKHEIFLTETFTLGCSYEELAPLERLLAQYDIRPSRSDFGDKVSLTVHVRRSLADKFSSEITEKFYGKVIITTLE
ncbi:MAG TPA: YigZ family protein [Candidatus Kapabacteria bacterium]|nr:YigZ family protein [Candidatus Kapabacteria bacterium]